MMAKGHAVSGDVCRADYCAKLSIQLDGEKSNMTDEIAELRELAIYCQGFLGCEESRDSMALHGITIKAKELLDKHK